MKRRSPSRSPKTKGAATQTIETPAQIGFFESFRLAREDLQSIIEQLPIGVIFVEAPVGKSVLYNQLSASIFRHPFKHVENVQDYGAWKVFHLDGTPMAPARYPLARAIIGGEVTVGEHLLTERGDGTHGIISANAGPIRNADGRIVAAIVAFQDITEQREAERSLALSEKKYRQIIETTSEGVWTIDAEAITTYVNPRMAQMIGYTCDEILGRHIYEFMDDRARVEAQIHLTARRTGLKSEHDFRIRRKDGSDLWATVKASPILDERGNYAGSLAMISDNSRRKQAELELRLLNSQLEERIARRTAALDSMNEGLRREIAKGERLESQLLQVSEFEQCKIGRELHDDLGQQLSALTMLMSVLQRKIERSSPTDAPFATEITEHLKRSIHTARKLAKGLYPVDLELGGLGAALTALSQETEAATGVRCTFRTETSLNVSHETGLHLFRIVREVVSDAIKRGRATHITIAWIKNHDAPVLTILTDGALSDKNQPTGIGSELLEYRARIIGARIEVLQKSLIENEFRCTLKSVSGCDKLV